MEAFKSRNGISKGDRVLFTGGSRLRPDQTGLANKYLKQGTLYIVEFVFPGTEFEQIELEGITEVAFVHDMFVRVG